MTNSLCLPASAISFFTSSELLELAEKTNSITFAALIARTMASWKFSPGWMLRHEIQQSSPRPSKAWQMVSAVFWSADA
jgi:hypothetical protein